MTPRPQQCGDVVQGPLEAGQVRTHSLQAEGRDQGIGRQGCQASSAQGLGLVHVDGQDPLHPGSQLALLLLPGFPVWGAEGRVRTGFQVPTLSSLLPPTSHSRETPYQASPPSPYPLPSMRQTCWLYTLQSKAPGSSRSQSLSSWRFTSRKSVMVMSSKWAQALSSWYIVGPEPTSMRLQPDTSPGWAEEASPGARPAAPSLSHCLPFLLLGPFSVLSPGVKWVSIWKKH